MVKIESEPESESDSSGPECADTPGGALELRNQEEAQEQQHKRCRTRTSNKTTSGGLRRVRLRVPEAPSQGPERTLCWKCVCAQQESGDASVMRREILPRSLPAFPQAFLQDGAQLRHHPKLTTPLEKPIHPCLPDSSHTPHEVKGHVGTGSGLRNETPAQKKIHLLLRGRNVRLLFRAGPLWPV